jgi:hypothetical protein
MNPIFQQPARKWVSYIEMNGAPKMAMQRARIMKVMNAPRKTLVSSRPPDQTMATARTVMTGARSCTNIFETSPRSERARKMPGKIRDDWNVCGNVRM